MVYINECFVLTKSHNASFPVIKQLPESSVEANSEDSNLVTTPLISQLQPSTITQERFRSIDAFRGYDIK
jgi:hypothetical protein